MVRYPRLVLWDPHEGTDLLPPWSLTRLSLLVAIRTSQQSIEDDPDIQIPLSITGLLKPQFRNLPTDRINASLLSFESLLQRIERYSNIKFDAARDELGWVEQPLQLDRKNNLGLSPPQEIILQLWSPAPKVSNARMSYQGPNSQSSTSSEEPKAQVGSSQPSNLNSQPTIDASRNRPAKDESPDLLQNPPPASMAPLYALAQPPAPLSISATSVQAIREAEHGAEEHSAHFQWTASDVVEDPSSQEIGNHLTLTATEQSQSNAHSVAHFEPQRNVLNSARLSSQDLPKDGPITDMAQDQMPGAWGDW